MYLSRCVCVEKEVKVASSQNTTLALSRSLGQSTAPYKAMDKDTSDIVLLETWLEQVRVRHLTFTACGRRVYRCPFIRHHVRFDDNSRHNQCIQICLQYDPTSTKNKDWTPSYAVFFPDFVLMFENQPEYPEAKGNIQQAQRMIQLGDDVGVQYYTPQDEGGYAQENALVLSLPDGGQHNESEKQLLLAFSTTEECMAWHNSIEDWCRLAAYANMNGWTLDAAGNMYDENGVLQYEPAAEYGEIAQEKGGMDAEKKSPESESIDHSINGKDPTLLDDPPVQDRIGTSEEGSIADLTSDAFNYPGSGASEAEDDTCIHFFSGSPVIPKAKSFRPVNSSVRENGHATLEYPQHRGNVQGLGCILLPPEPAYWRFDYAKTLSESASFTLLYASKTLSTEPFPFALSQPSNSQSYPTAAGATTGTCMSSLTNTSDGLTSQNPGFTYTQRRIPETYKEANGPGFDAHRKSHLSQSMKQKEPALNVDRSNSGQTLGRSRTSRVRHKNRIRNLLEALYATDIQC